MNNSTLSLPISADYGDRIVHQGQFSGERTPALAFFGLVSFMLIMLVRPFDFFPALAGFHLAKLVFAVAMVGWFLTGRKTTLFHHRTNKYAAGLLLAMFISIPFSYWPTRSLEAAIDHAKLTAVFLLIIHLMTNIRAMVTLMWLLVLSISVHAAIVIKDYLAGAHLNGRVFGVKGSIFTDPNDLALSFIVMLPIAICLAARFQGTWRLILHAALSLLFLSGLVATQSRGGLLGLIAIGAMMIKDSQKKAVAVIAALLLGAAVVAYAPPGSFDRYRSISEYENEGSAKARLRTMRTGLRMWADHPIIGVGVDAFHVAYGNRYLSPGEKKWNAAHCSPLNVAVELGTPGLIIWMGMILGGFGALRDAQQLLKPILHRSVAAMQLSSLCTAIKISLIGFLVCAMFLSRSYDFLLLALLALCVSSWLLARNMSTAFSHESRLVENSVAL